MGDEAALQYAVRKSIVVFISVYQSRRESTLPLWASRDLWSTGEAFTFSLGLDIFSETPSIGALRCLGLRAERRVCSFAGILDFQSGFRIPAVNCIDGD